jgi:4-amino-4-deoxy-L-arabinose transferase-like glycosyltransferase
VTNPQKKTLIAILIVSVLIRLLAALYLGNEVKELPGTFDQISYNLLAQRVLDGHGFTFGTNWWPATLANAPTAHWSYLYTSYLILVYALFAKSALAARIIQAVLTGLAHPYLAYLIGREVFSPATGLVAAALTAVYTYFIYYSASLMTEPFYLVLILTSLWLAIRLARSGLEPPLRPGGLRQSAWVLGLALGLSLGAVILLRQLFMLIIPFIFLWVWWASRRKQIWPLVLSGLVIVAMIVPFTFFNYLRFDRFVLLNTNAGYAFFWANHPIYGTHFVPILTPEMGSYADLIPKELLSLDEAALDQALLKRGFEFIIQDPVRYFLLSLSRIPAYFMFWPSVRSSSVSNLARVGGFGLLLPFMLYGLYRSAVSWVRPYLDQPVMLLYLFVGVYTAVHLLSWALVRYRLPVDAVLVLFAGLALVDLAERIPALGRVVRTVA